MSDTTRRTRIALWIVQVLLAALFLFAGGFKLSMSSADLAAATGLPGPFMKLVSACEVAGALGLILPGLLRTRTALTSVAAVGLSGIMAGATTLTVTTTGVPAAAFPFVVGILAALVAVGRRERKAPVTALESTSVAARVEAPTHSSRLDGGRVAVS